MDRFQTCSYSNHDRAEQPMPGYRVHTVPPSTRLMSCNHNKHSWQCKSEAQPGNVDRRPTQTSLHMASCGPRTLLCLYIKTQGRELDDMSCTQKQLCCHVLNFVVVIKKKFMHYIYYVSMLYTVCKLENSVNRKKLPTTTQSNNIFGFSWSLKLRGLINSSTSKLQASHLSGQSSALPTVRGTGAGGVMPK